MAAHQSSIAIVGIGGAGGVGGAGVGGGGDGSGGGGGDGAGGDTSATVPVAGQAQDKVYAVHCHAAG